MSHESLINLLQAVDPFVPEQSKVPEYLRFGFDAALFDKDGTLITKAPEGPPGGSIIEIESWSMYHDRVQILPGRIQLIRELREAGVKLGVVTGDWREPTEELLEKMGVRDAFDVVITDDDIEIESKPHPEAFLRARSSLKVHPRRCVMIGDSPDDDIAGAKWLGMKTVLVPSYRWGRGDRSGQIPGPQTDLVVLSHEALTAKLLRAHFGQIQPNPDLEASIPSVTSVAMSDARSLVWGESVRV